jgi:hypothetical protein
MNVRYRVELSQAERCELTAMLSKGKRAARKLKRAQILLAADAGCSEEIARTVATGTLTACQSRNSRAGFLESGRRYSAVFGSDKRDHENHYRRFYIGVVLCGACRFTLAGLSFSNG